MPHCQDSLCSVSALSPKIYVPHITALVLNEDTVLLCRTAPGRHFWSSHWREGFGSISLGVHFSTWKGSERSWNKVLSSPVEVYLTQQTTGEEGTWRLWGSPEPLPRRLQGAVMIINTNCSPSEVALEIKPPWEVSALHRVQLRRKFHITPPNWLTSADGLHVASNTTLPSENGMFPFATSVIAVSSKPTYYNQFQGCFRVALILWLCFYFKPTRVWETIASMVFSLIWEGRCRLMNRVLFSYSLVGAVVRRVKDDLETSWHAVRPWEACGKDKFHETHPLDPIKSCNTTWPSSAGRNPDKHIKLWGMLWAMGKMKPSSATGKRLWRLGCIRHLAFPLWKP